MQDEQGRDGQPKQQWSQHTHNFPFGPNKTMTTSAATMPNQTELNKMRSNHKKSLKRMLVLIRQVLPSYNIISVLFEPFVCFDLNFRLWAVNFISGLNKRNWTEQIKFNKTSKQKQNHHQWTISFKPLFSSSFFNVFFSPFLWHFAAKMSASVFFHSLLLWTIVWKYGKMERWCQWYLVPLANGWKPSPDKVHPWCNSENSN